MEKKQKNKQSKKGDIPNLMEDQKQLENEKDKSLNIDLNSDKEIEEEEEIDSEKEEQEEKEEENGEDEDEEKKEMKSFTIELLIHTLVMDNREEIKKCICRNHIILDEKEQKKELQENENIYIEKEIIPSVEIPIIKETNENKIINQIINIESPDKFYIKLNDLTKSLQKLGFPLSGSMINIFINYADNYVFFGTEPLDNKTILYSYMLEPNKDVIRMKIINYIQKRMLDGYTNSIINTYFRKPIQNKNKNKEKKEMPSLELKPKIFTPSMTNLEYYAEGSNSEESSSSLPSVISFDKDDYNDMPLKENENKEKKIKENFGKMTDSKKRERKIGYIIEKVYAWRKLYNGFKDEKNNFLKYSLDNAAEKIAVSKKSLDDYLLQIRLGRKYGFDFDKNKYKKIGELREHVKKEKEKREPIPIKKKRNLKKKKEKKGNKDEIEEISNEKNFSEEKNNEKENGKLMLKERKFLEDLKLEKNNSKMSIKSNKSNRANSFIGKKRNAKK